MNAWAILAPSLRDAERRRLCRERLPGGQEHRRAAPTGVVGESGFVVDADETVDYWAVREEVGIFAVGKLERDTRQSIRSGRPTGLCGIGLVEPILLATFAFFIRRTARRTH